MQAEFPVLADVKLDEWLFAVNAVRPSFIRVEADEVTYGLHIMLRFDLERQMLSGQLQVRDIPAAWNDGMQRLLGITPPDDAQLSRKTSSTTLASSSLSAPCTTTVFQFDCSGCRRRDH